jgi:uncharacterized membrane protein YgcG
MRKSTVFISSVLTAFMLAVLFGVVSAYKQTDKPAQPMTDTQSDPAVVQVANPPPANDPPAVNISLEQAAALAAKVIGHTDLYSVENSQLDGVNAFLVTFSSGDIVYVSLDGQILSISKLPVSVVNQPSSGGGGGSGGGHSGGGHAEKEHEGGGHDD